jgi:hypothetical protein
VSLPCGLREERRVRLARFEASPTLL